jgi:hypothetical protein
MRNCSADDLVVPVAIVSDEDFRQRFLADDGVDSVLIGDLVELGIGCLLLCGNTY